MAFIEEKNQIISNLRRGDKTTIANNANVDRSTVWRSHQAKSISEMSTAEKKAWKATIEFVNTKINQDQKNIEITTKVARRL